MPRPPSHVGIWWGLKARSCLSLPVCEMERGLQVIPVRSRVPVGWLFAGLSFPIRRGEGFVGARASWVAVGMD